MSQSLNSAQPPGLVRLLRGGLGLWGRWEGRGETHAKHWFTSFGQSRMEPARNRAWTRSNGVWNVQSVSTSSTSNWTFGGTLKLCLTPVSFLRFVRRAYMIGWVGLRSTPRTWAEGYSSPENM
jgi:hypothetical protein